MLLSKALQTDELGWKSQKIKILFAIYFSLM